MSVDLAADPTTGTFSSTGTLAFTRNGVAGNLADYTADLSFPIVFSDVILDTNTIVATMTIDGVVGASGPATVILPPPTVTQWTGAEPGGPQLVADVEPGATYAVDHTDDFLSWHPADTVTATTTEFTYSDPADPLPPGRAYRVRFD